MAKALEKYGIQMPSFGKIGGILASEIAYDEAASEYRHLSTSRHAQLLCCLKCSF